MSKKLFLSIWCLIIFNILQAQSLPQLIPFKKGNLWGYADSTGKIKIEPKWYVVDFFDHGKAIVYPDVDKNGQKNWKWKCIIDTFGNYIIPPDRHWDGGLPNHLNCYNAEGKWGIIDSLNQEIIPLIYDWINNQQNNYNKFESNTSIGVEFMIAQKNGKQGIINRSNQEIIPFDYDQIIRYHKTYNEPYSIFVVEKNKQYGLINWNNKILIPIKYDSVFIDDDLKTSNIIYVIQNGKTGIMDTNNNIIMPPKFYNLKILKSDPNLGFQITNKKGDRFGWLNKEGKVLLRPIFSQDIPEFLDNGMITIRVKNGKVALFDSSGTLLLPPQYESIYIQNDSIVASNLIHNSKKKTYPLFQI